MEKPGMTRVGIMDMDRPLFYSTAKFINSLHNRVADMGCANAKSSYIAEFYQYDIEQIDDDDFNFWKVPRIYVNAFDIVLCLEVLEHLQNPLLFMSNVKKMLKPDGTLFLSLPARPRFLWIDYHFFEMNIRTITQVRYYIFNIINSVGPSDIYFSA